MMLKRNKTTGKAEVWEDDKKVGEVITMGDIIMQEEHKHEEKGKKK